MNNKPILYEDKIKDRDNEFLYNKCINQYHQLMNCQYKNKEYKNKIYNLQSKIDKVIELNNKIINSSEEKVKINCDGNYYLIFDAGYTRILAGLINDILKENKYETNSN